MIKDNRGLSLIELLVSLAIFSVVLTAVFGFMMAGSRAYTKISNRLSLDLEAELLLNRLSESMIDCNGTVWFQNRSLYVVNLGNSGYSAEIFTFKPEEGSIFYGSGAAKLEAAEPDLLFSTSVTAPDLLSQSIAVFDIRPESTDGRRLDSVHIFIKLTKGTDIYTAERSLALRNRPALGIVKTG